MGISLYNYNYILLITYADKSRTLKKKKKKKKKYASFERASTNIKSFYKPYKVKPNITLFQRFRSFRTSAIGFTILGSISCYV